MDIKRYKLRGGTIEAVRLADDKPETLCKCYRLINGEDIPENEIKHIVKRYCNVSMAFPYSIRGESRVFAVKIGEWIIKTPNNDICVCKASLFSKFYEEDNEN